MKNPGNEAAPSQWKSETEERKAGIVGFLESHFATPDGQRARYDSLTELHFSGSNSDVMSKIQNGSGVQVNEVGVLYGGTGDIEQIHVVFDSEKAGHNLDLYLYRTALKDYLEFENK